MQLSPYGGLGGLRGELMSNNPYQPKPGMAQQLGRQQMSAPDMSGHRADVQARYGLTDEETTAAIESKGQSLGGRSPVPGATSYDGTPLGAQQDPEQMINVDRRRQMDMQQEMLAMRQPGQQFGPPQNIAYQQHEQRKLPGFAKPLSSAPSEQGTGGGLADQEWRLKIEPVEMSMGGRIPGYQNGGDIPPPPIPEAPLFAKRRKTMGGRLSHGVPIGELGEGYGQEQIDAGESPFPMGYLKKRGVLMRSPGTPENVAAREELDRTLGRDMDPLEYLKHMMELRKLYYEPTEDNPEGWPMPTTRRYGGGIVGLAHGGMVPGYAHGGEVPGYFLGGLWKGIKSLGEKGLQYAPQIMGLIGDEIPGFNKLSGLGRAAVGALAKQGSNKLSGGKFNLREALSDANRVRTVESAKDRIRDSLGRDIGGPEGRRTVEEMMKGGSGEGWERSAASGDRYEPTFIADEKGSGSMWKDIFTDSDAAKTALEAALDISPLEMMALNFTEQERKRGEQGESTGNLGFDPMSTVGRRMPTSMSAVSGRPATSAPDIASQLTYGNMPADYTGRAEGGMIPGYQYGGMYGEEEGGGEFGLEQYLPKTVYGSRRSRSRRSRAEAPPENIEPLLPPPIVPPIVPPPNPLIPAPVGPDEPVEPAGSIPVPDVPVSAPASYQHLGQVDDQFVDEVEQVLPRTTKSIPATDISSWQPEPTEGGENSLDVMTSAQGSEAAAEAAAEAVNARQRQEAADYAMRNKDYSDLSFEDEVKRQKKEKQTEAKKELIATNELDPDDRGEQVEEMGEVDEQELYTIDDKKAANMKKDAGLTPSGKIDLNTGEVTKNQEYIDANTQYMGEHYGQGSSSAANTMRVMPGSTNPTYGTSNQFSGAGSGFYGENKWFDPNAKEVAAKGISGLNPHELPRTAADFKKTGDKAGADLLARLGKAEGGMIESIGPMLESITPEDMQALMMASEQLDSPNSRDVVASIMRKYQLSATDLNQMLEILRAEMQSAQQPMQAGGLIDDIPGYGIGGALKKALKVASFGAAQLLPEEIRDPLNKAGLAVLPYAAKAIPGVGHVASAALKPITGAVSNKIDADRARDSIADSMNYGQQEYQEGGLINGGGGDAMSDDIYVNAQMEANGDTQKIAVSAGEYIVPGDVVSHLGSGNTDGGADVMDQFIEDVRVQRTGTPVQPDPIDLSDVLPDTYGDRYV